MTELLAKLEAALLKRNPGIAPFLAPGLPPDTIKQQLKKVSVKGLIDPIVELYAWHDGTRFSKECEAMHLGFAPPTVSPIPQANLEFLQSLGHKVDPNQKMYGSFLFFYFEGVINQLKLWKKFSKTNPSNAILMGRFLPFIRYSQTAQEIALDTDPAASGRLVTIQPDNMRAEPLLREAYPSFTDFLHDAIDANENNRVLSCFQTPGNPIELAAPPPAAVESPPKTKRKKLPETKHVIALRTDFSDENAWQSLREKLSRSDRGLELEFISDPQFASVSAKQLAKILPENYPHSFAILIDQKAPASPDHPVLIVDLQETPGRSFRAVAESFADVYDNLSTANMDFAEFADAADKEGIFRSFD